jgi:hypothetical protein
MKWADNSEIVAGLILSGKIAPNAVRPELFMPPYDGLIKQIKQGVVGVETLIETIGLTPVQAAIDAAKSVNGLGTANWVQILESTCNFYAAGQKLERLGRKLQKGDDIEWGQLTAISSSAQRGIASDFTPLSEIAGNITPFVSSGWLPFDEHLGGYPKSGLVIIAGQAGIGKTSLMAKIVSKYAQGNSNKLVLVYSIEMMREEIAIRFREIETIEQSVEKRILLCELPVTPDEVISKAAAHDNVGLIAIDFADLMIRGETTESSMANIYRVLALGSKTLGCPIILLAHPHRTGGGIPKPNQIRYTGMAENLAWMIMMLYDPSRDWGEPTAEEKALLPVIEDKAYIIVWKIRGGYRMHREESPGAILLPFRGDKGWGEKGSKWFSLRKL